MQIMHNSPNGRVNYHIFFFKGNYPEIPIYDGKDNISATTVDLPLPPRSQLRALLPLIDKKVMVETMKRTGYIRLNHQLVFIVIIIVYYPTDPPS